LINEGLIDYEERNYRNSWVPLHEAAFYNSAACIRVLLDSGAPLRPRTDQGKTPVQLAEEGQCAESILLLRQHQTPSAKSSLTDWFHDQLYFGRFAAKKLIESVKTDTSNGVFVVRYSSQNLKNYALTLYHEKEFFNFEIIRLNETSFYIDDGPYFDSLEHLIDHYCRIRDGLPTVLMYSVNQAKALVPSRVQPFANSRTNRKTQGTFTLTCCV
jgi:tyrosine-protein kinase